MAFIAKYFWRIIAGLALLSVVTGVIFGHVITYPGVPPTPLPSLIFGWEWVYLLLASVGLLVHAIAVHRGAVTQVARILLITLAIIFVPAQIVVSNRLYITGEGGPAGPQFDCLGWNNDVLNTSGAGRAYDPRNILCTVMSLPGYTKFLIDRRVVADQQRTSPTYYFMFGVDEAILAGGLVLVHKKLSTTTSES